MKNTKKTLFIIGYGPGDPELLTIKAQNTIKNADILLFDKLINEEILEIASKKCKKVCIDNLIRKKSTSQDEINELIIYYCKHFTRVVRLKDGDPYIFGSGFDEWLVAKKSGIDVQYIPGISSMQGAGLNTIPLTHRGISDGIWVITGTAKEEGMAADLSLAVNSNSTVVIHMGMFKLAKIARTYLINGKGNKPAAIIQHVSISGPKKVICRVRDLVKASQKTDPSHPAIIIIGEVVNLSLF